MLQLPNELICHIFEFITCQNDLEAIHSLMSVCQRWKFILEDESSSCWLNIWKRFCQENRWMEDDHSPCTSFKLIYRNGWIENRPIPSRWLDSMMEEARKKRLYPTEDVGIHVRCMSSKYQQPGELRFHSNIPIRRPYVMEFYSGYDNDNCEIPDNINWHIPKSLTYHPISNRYPCPRCNDTKQEKNLIYIYHFDRSHDWGTDVEYQCQNCNCYLFYSFYTGA